MSKTQPCTSGHAVVFPGWCWVLQTRNVEVSQDCWDLLNMSRLILGVLCSKLCLHQACRWSHTCSSPALETVQHFQGFADHTPGSCACHTAFSWRNNLAAAPDLRVHQWGTEEMQKRGKHRDTAGWGRTGSRVGQHQAHGGHCSEAAGATQALLSFALEQLCLQSVPCQLWGVTGVIPHVLRSHTPSLQSFTLILGRERKFVLTFAFISLNR